MKQNRVENSLPSYLRPHRDGTTLSVRVQPRAHANAIGAAMGDSLKISVTAPPVEAAANEALLRFLADTLDCPRHAVELSRGHTSRRKVIVIHGLAPGVVAAKLARSQPKDHT